ncbi:MAG: holo-ACP synthase [Burkholderiales bacterium]|nr:holo-ACP synthase [Burkholderiales bacterium]
MIYGIGTDLVEIQRIRAAYARHGERFILRLLSPAERARVGDFADPGPYLAKRWAAKEAFSKALGTGVMPPVTLAGITVASDASGKPVLAFDDAIQAYMSERGITRAHLSLSDERLSAVAFVILECEG